MKKIVTMGILLGLFSVSSCSRLAQVDKSMVNHQAMDLANEMTDKTSSAFTTLSGGAGASAGCAT